MNLRPSLASRPATRFLLLLLSSVPLLLGGGAAGCASTDPQARARQRPGFNALPAAERRLALAGQVRDGMSADAVFVAWGRPTQVYRGTANGRPLEAWVYLRAAPARPSPDFGNYPADYLAARADFLGAYYRGDRFYNYPGPYFSGFYPGAVFYPGPVPGSLGSDAPILDRQAIFENGRLVRHVRLANGTGSAASRW